LKKKRKIGSRIAEDEEGKRCGGGGYQRDDGGIIKYLE